jgi:sugar phosphate isomerase/epimerase
MSIPLSRRALLQAAAALPAALPFAASAQPRVVRAPGTRIRLALNAYSFDKPLRAGTIDLAGLVRFCAEQGLEGLDATGYYFPGYPKAPSDEAIRGLKHAALVNGVSLCGTGVRNDFATADAAARAADLAMVKAWIDVAARLGAPVIRVFSGPRLPAGHTFDQVLAWMIPAFQECAAYGAGRGVMLGLQPHNDFIKTSDEAIRITQAVGSEWFGVILDIGSLRQNDAYAEIEKLVPYAVSWQLKENLGIGGKEVPTDLRRLKAIVDKVGYRGFMPIETLGGGDPKEKVPAYLAQVRAAFGM